MIRRPPRSTHCISSAASDVYKRQPQHGTGPDALSLDQGISESAIKDKWIPVYHELLTYHPPPRTITALQRAGAITPERAAQLYQEAGLSPELAAAYGHAASMEKTAKHRNLAESQVLTMYRDHALTADQAHQLLLLLGYDEAEVGMLLAWEDVYREVRAVNSAVTKIGSLYISRHIGTVTVHAQLNALGLPATQVDELLRVWELERQAKRQTLTAAEIASGLHHQIIDQDTAQAALVDLGFSDWDAWFYLSQHEHQALPGEPPREGAVTGAAP